MIEVKTILSAQLMRKYNRAQAMKKIWIAFVGLAVLVGIGVMCMFDDDLGLPFSVPIICVGIALPVFYMFFSIIPNLDSVDNKYGLPILAFLPIGKNSLLLFT